MTHPNPIYPINILVYAFIGIGKAVLGPINDVLLVAHYSLDRALQLVLGHV